MRFSLENSQAALFTFREKQTNLLAFSKPELNAKGPFHAAVISHLAAGLALRQIFYLSWFVMARAHTPTHTVKKRKEGQ